MTAVLLGLGERIVMEAATSVMRCTSAIQEVPALRHLVETSHVCANQVILRRLQFLGSCSYPSIHPSIYSQSAYLKKEAY